MSIVLLVRSLNYGGTERQLVELAKGLRAQGHSVVVVVFYGGGPLVAELEDSGISVAVLEKQGRWDLVRFLYRLARLLRRLRPQVIYSFLVEPSLIAVALRPLLPSTQIVWGVRASNMAFAWYDWFPRFNFQVSRVFARFADCIIANSRAGATYHARRGYPAAKLAVVSNGIDLDRFRPDVQAGRHTRSQWGLEGSHRVVGIVGRHDPIKDHSTCLEAFSILRQAGTEFRLVCVGDEVAGHTELLHARAEALGISDKVLWVPPQKDMTAVYNAFDVLCSSSVSEGFSNVLAEAMACGVPCVATDVGDAAMILDGCGFVVAPGDPQGLASGIRQALGALGPERARACRERIERKFSLEQMVKETERLLRERIDAAR